MTEYRVICDRDELHVYNGKEYFKKAIRPWLNGVPVKNEFKTREKAEAFLERAIKESAAYEERRNAEKGPNTIKMKQYNFRIQTREVSEWR